MLYNIKNKYRDPYKLSKVVYIVRDLLFFEIKIEIESKPTAILNYRIGFSTNLRSAEGYASSHSKNLRMRHVA
jgi:hypothetical protein